MYNFILFAFKYIFSCAEPFASNCTTLLKLILKLNILIIIEN